MLNISRRLGIASIVLTVLAFPALAHQYKVGGLVLSHPWVRATPPGAEVAAGYVKITNSGSEPDRLVAFSSPAAQLGEIHIGSIVDGIAKMRRLENGVEIPAGATVELAPGGLHLMLVKLRQTLVEDTIIKATLTFEKAGAIEIELVVEKMGAAEGSHQ
jgi:copper(I)-binding protein